MYIALHIRRYWAAYPTVPYVWLRFSVAEMFSNSMSCYYLLLLNLMMARWRHGKTESRKHFLPVRTTNILLQLCAHCAISLRWWPKNLTWEPRSRTEARCEHHFSSIKRCNSQHMGQPHIAHAIYGTQRHHLSAFRSKKKLEKGRDMQPLSESEASALARRSLVQAVAFQSCISDDVGSPEKL